jgi:hypothetical protein
MPACNTASYLSTQKPAWQTGISIACSRACALSAVFWVFLVGSLAGCGGGKPSVPSVAPVHPNFVSQQPQDWYILYSQGLPDHPSAASDGSWTMNIPSAPGWIGYVQTPYHPTAAPGKITITFRLNSSSGAAYNGQVDPRALNPATFHLFLERAGDDLTAAKEYYRWWALEGFYVLGSDDNGVVTIEVPLTFDKWTSALGHQSETGFNDTLNDLAWVGLTFGGTNFFGHGVNMSAGTSEFTLIGYQVE